jgi:hypothetical protein
MIRLGMVTASRPIHSPATHPVNTANQTAATKTVIVRKALLPKSLPNRNIPPVRVTATATYRISGSVMETRVVHWLISQVNPTTSQLATATKPVISVIPARPRRRIRIDNMAVDAMARIKAIDTLHLFLYYSLSGDENSIEQRSPRLPCGNLARIVWTSAKIVKYQKLTKSANIGIMMAVVKSLVLNST